MNNDQENKSPGALREEKILAQWKEKDIFKKSLEKNKDKKEFVFFEGPPTANAKPALHHLEARAFKDVIPRFKTMQGYNVRRKAGWDTHGLPVELQIEKALGLTSKKDIEKYGIAKFNAKCRESVFEFIKDWEDFTDRIGYWVDKDDAYFTFDSHYVEALWGVVKKINDRGLLYKDYRIVPWCARCGTGLSSHELAQGYLDVKDLSVTAKFKLTAESTRKLRGTDAENTYLLAWTTTPWTLPGNVALAVGADIEYVEIKVGEEILVLAKERLSVIADPYEIIATHKGSEMVGMKYEPLYPFFSELAASSQSLDTAFKVYVADFVTTEDGTGIVHTAVMYGADDFALGTSLGLPKFHVVKEDGHFLDGMDFLSARFVKDEEVAIDIIKDLAHRGLLFKKEKYEHSYPHCWRCKTPLLYYARDSWYVAMSKLRNVLVSENEKINWEPTHIKDGRFGEWIREAKDWAFSRERYWGTPLPVWKKTDGTFVVLGNLDEIKRHTKKSGNTYFVMRHGETKSNVEGRIDSLLSNGTTLTENGVDQVLKSSQFFQDKNIDLIFTSPLARTKETAEIVQKDLGLSDECVIAENRIIEMQVGTYEGKTWEEYHNDFPKTVENFDQKKENDESYEDVKKRVGEFLYDIESKYQNKNILIVTHGAPAWMLFSVASGKNREDTLGMIKDISEFHYFQNAEIKQLSFVPLSHNEKYEFDPHRPFIDDLQLVDEKGEPMIRENVVMDVWFDSGAMPFAQYADERRFDADGRGYESFEDLWKRTPYPADFISEAIDQTRGWFYTLLAVGVLMERGTPYKNVICLGHLLDKDGKKMSKSIGNVVEPWEQMAKYGVDTIRLWMYSVNQPGEGKNYDEKIILELSRKVFALLDNCYTFYDQYKNDSNISSSSFELPNTSHVLDKWIVSLLHKMIKEGTDALEKYDLFTASRLIKDFVNDFSTWYIRRSRDRFKSDDVEDKNNALATTRYVILELAKYMAPFTPFYADDLYQKVGGEKESVHLEDWSTEHGTWDTQILSDMEMVRDIVTKGLEARQKAGIKVRQPLGTLKVKSEKLKEEYFEILKDELNVKEILLDSSSQSLEADVVLDSEITPELKMEGDFRELVRGIQDLRKTSGLTPSDRINLSIDTNEDGKKVVETFVNELKKIVQADEVIFESNDGQEIKVDEIEFKVKI
ncbi:MAG: isoleucyl-tRNA synthetase [Patescibacteria group bacterium]|nr:isoleucyl-tRNA synthetase [Patescibacteria group bacterium]